MPGSESGNGYICNKQHAATHQFNGTTLANSVILEPALQLRDQAKVFHVALRLVDVFGDILHHEQRRFQGSSLRRCGCVLEDFLEDQRVLEHALVRDGEQVLEAEPLLGALLQRVKVWLKPFLLTEILEARNGARQAGTVRAVQDEG